MSKRLGSDLHHQALRLPQHTRDRLIALASVLHAAGCHVAPAEAARGLCMLALDLALGAAGTQAAEAFCLAASDPTAHCVRTACENFRWHFDSKIASTLQSDEANEEDERGAYGSNRFCRGLVSQALRLPQIARDQLDALVANLRADGAPVTSAEVVRGLCLLAVNIVFGAAGVEVADAFRIAASNPTVEGTRKAVEAIEVLLEGVPSTMPSPPWFDDAPRETAEDSTPPSMVPSSRAA